MMKAPREWMVEEQAEGVLTLKVTRGWGSRERLVKDEMVMARQSSGSGEVEVVRITTVEGDNVSEPRSTVCLGEKYVEGRRLTWVYHVSHDTAELDGYILRVEGSANINGNAIVRVGGRHKPPRGNKEDGLIAFGCGIVAEGYMGCNWQSRKNGE